MENVMNFADEVKAYFSEAEWMDLSETEKTRNCRIYSNYKELCIILPDASGFMPYFMKPNSAGAAKPKAKKAKKHPENKENYNPRVKKTSIATRKNPRRSVPAINYTEAEVPRVDQYVFCDNCEKDCIDHCAKCGDLKHLKDHRVAMGTEDRARLTVPKGILEVKASQKHGLGVFALRYLPKGIRMGPYEGELLKTPSGSSYSWKLRGLGLIDAANESNSNWMRYVNSANHVDEQNLVAFQYLGNIYYRTSAEIKVGDELLVYYGNDFAKELGLDTVQYFKPKTERLDEYEYCKFCCFGFLRNEHLHRHMARCENNPNNKEGNTKERETFPCRYCGVLISSKEFLNAHERWCRAKYSAERKADGTEEDKKYKCEKCNYQTNNYCSLKRHFHVHKKTFSFFCEQCDYKTNQKGNLMIHINQKHTKEIVFTCKQCIYFCYEKSSLRKHERNIHSNIKQFVCNFCKQGFNTKYYLTAHMHKHENKKPLKCDFCEYSSVYISNINRHINAMHTKIKTYSCSKCDYITNFSRALKYHLFTHKSMKPFKCNICEYSAIQAQQLRKHIKNKHGAI